MPQPCNHDSHEAYEKLIGPLREKARELGYALAVHGSLVRDIDLIAVPWISGAVQPYVLAEALRVVAAEHGPCGVAFLDPHERGRYFLKGCPEGKPHGRLVWCFHLGGGPYLDISVIRPHDPPRGDVLEGMVTLGEVSDLAV